VSDEMLSPEHDEHAWISLQEASERLEVAVATVRRWGDAGRVPMKRTLGGHRRFLASAIDELARTLPASAERAPTQSGPQSWGVNPHELTRQSWHIRMAAQAHPERLRGLGQRLLGLLIQFVNRDPEDARFLEEARPISACTTPLKHFCSSGARFLRSHCRVLHSQPTWSRRTGCTLASSALWTRRCLERLRAMRAPAHKRNI
jgi:excisionase family DNA binding protein